MNELTRLVKEATGPIGKSVTLDISYSIRNSLEKLADRLADTTAKKILSTYKGKMIKVKTDNGFSQPGNLADVKISVDFFGGGGLVAPGDRSDPYANPIDISVYFVLMHGRKKQSYYMREPYIIKVMP